MRQKLVAKVSCSGFTLSLTGFYITSSLRGTSKFINGARNPAQSEVHSMIYARDERTSEEQKPSAEGHSESHRGLADRRKVRTEPIGHVLRDRNRCQQTERSHGVEAGVNKPSSRMVSQS